MPTAVSEDYQVLIRRSERLKSIHAQWVQQDKSRIDLTAGGKTRGRRINFGCWMLDVGCWMLDVGCWMLDVGCWMLDVGLEEGRDH